jgi:hypothetical protein
MSVVRYTFTTRKAHCLGCDTRQKVLGWLHEPLPECPACGGTLQAVTDHVERATFVIGDEIDVVHEHGVCHADNTPRRFRSRQELKRAEQAAGVRLLERGERFAGDERSRQRYEQRQQQQREMHRL